MSTTNKVDNGKVILYYGVVSAQIVAGTGFLSDFAAGLSDFFGGRSGSYRRQLEGLYEEALDELSDKAKYLGANGILGLTIDERRTLSVRTSPRCTCFFSRNQTVHRSANAELRTL